MKGFFIFADKRVNGKAAQMEEDVLMYPLFGRKTKDLNLHQTIQQTSEVDNGKEKENTALHKC